MSDYSIIPRNNSLDFIKIVAMFMVLMLHTGVCRSGVGYPHIPYIYTIAGIAIPLFFMVSGFLFSYKNTIDYTYSIKKIIGILRFCFIICITFDFIKLLLTGDITLSFPECFIKRGTFSIFWYFGSMIIIYGSLPLLIKIIKSTQFKYYMLVFIFISFIVFILNFFFSLEKNIPNTLRIWNWFTYFLLGAFIRLYPKYFYMIKWYHSIIACFLFSFLVKHTQLNDYELWFSSPIVIFYAISVFMLCINSDFKQFNCIIKNLSACFLPIYALHMAIIWRLYKMFPITYIEKSLPTSISFLLEYVYLSLICVIIGLILSKIKFLNKHVFKI